ncbi:MAG: transketolase [SAR202 cluster bacterium]|jgi:transketolase|nr:transketolase [SAR202 cluster bacterium]|tara:strand:+ start:996 stop:1802 length:807 start_codon:yes stop_codon:yes gene_type:complete
MKRINDLENLAKIYRRDLFEKLLIMKQGHVGSIFSMMEIVVTLYHCGFVKFDEKRNIFLDKVLISKGHATATLYPILKDFGVIPTKEWDKWGHEDSLLRVFGNTSIPGIDVTSGSLGHGVGVGAGMAISLKRFATNKKVYVIISEGELYEGSTWEALLFAKHNKLDNLTIIIDINSLIILGKTSDCLSLDPIKNKIEGLGIKTLEVDGHDLNDLISTFENSRKVGEFNCILAKTIKGKGCRLMENKKHWHYWNHMSEEEIQQTRKELA